jgi:hypothetical protein
MDFNLLLLGDLLAHKAFIAEHPHVAEGFGTGFDEYLADLNAEIEKRRCAIDKLAVPVGIFAGCALVLVVSLILGSIDDLGGGVSLFMSTLGLAAVLIMGILTMIAVFNNGRIKEAENDWLSEVAWKAHRHAEALENEDSPSDAL